MRRIKTDRKTLITSAILTIAAVAACGMGTSAPPNHEPTADDAILLFRAEDVLIGDCMRRMGFHYWTNARQPMVEEREFPYVVDDVDWATRHGYGSEYDALLEQVRAADPNRHYVSELPVDRRTAYTTALNGSGAKDVGVLVTLPNGAIEGQSANSCTAIAESQLYGDFALWFRAHAITTALKQMWRANVVTDPAYLTTVMEWSTCMKLRGYVYTNPADARTNYRGNSAGTQREAEMRTAVAEAECANTTGLAGTAQRLDTQHARATRAKYRSAVDTEDRLIAGALPRARTIMQAINPTERKDR